MTEAQDSAAATAVAEPPAVAPATDGVQRYSFRRPPRLGGTGVLLYRVVWPVMLAARCEVMEKRR